MKRQKKTTKQQSVAPLVATVTSAAATEFDLNPFYERLLEMQEQKPSAFNNLSAATRLAVQAYVKAKQAFWKPEANKTAA
ncbi:MAG TPA: hypothetical protein VF666_18700 [Pyrinomonadaceae bacterium]|jgi:predicted DNA-binding ribbon-helix-helix protein